MREHFLEDETYRQLVDDLMAIAGRVDRQKIINALAAANVWPMACFLDSANCQKGPTRALIPRSGRARGSNENAVEH